MRISKLSDMDWEENNVGEKMCMKKKEREANLMKTQFLLFGGTRKSKFNDVFKIFQ